VPQTARALFRTPWFSLSIVGVIALMTALNASVFAVVDGSLFSPLPYRNPGRLFAVAAGHRQVPDSVRIRMISSAEGEVWKAAVPGAGFTRYQISQLWTSNTESVLALSIEPSFFEVLGIAPPAGGFGPEDFSSSPGKIRPVIVTHRFWLNRLGGRSDAVGRVLAADDGTGIRIAAILSPDVFLPELRQVLTPLPSRSPTRARSVHALIRLPPDMPTAEASARLTAAAERDAASVAPNDGKTTGDAAQIRSRPFDRVDLVPIREALTSGQRELALAATAAAAILTLLGCFNITGLALARVRDRRSDLAIRRSLGAGRGHVLRLIGGEYAVLVAVGLGVGVLLAPIIVNGTIQLMPASIRLLKPPLVDGRAMAMSGVAAALTLVVITLAAAHAAWRNAASLPAASERMTLTRPARLIISAQVALGLVVSVGSALIIAGLFRVWGSDAGLNVEDTAAIRISSARLTAPEIESLAADLRIVPGVRQAGGVNRWLLQQSFNGNEFGAPAGAPALGAESMPITSGYFEAAGLAALEGRLITADEFGSGARVLAVSEIVARSYWPNDTAIGKTLTMAGQPFEIVGVVGDSRYVALDRESSGAIYWPLSAQPNPSLMNVLVEFDPHRTSLVALGAWVASRCPSPCRVTNVDMIEDAMANSIRPWRFRAWIFLAFGTSALAVVALGTFGLVMMTTARRWKEMGIRLALGSTPAGVIRKVLVEQVLAVGIGLVAGVVAAFWSVRLVRAYLYDTELYDLSVWAPAVGVLLLVTFGAVLIPALRASRVNPISVLREG
jgi:predicted permease